MMTTYKDLTPEQCSLLAGLVGHFRATAGDKQNIFRSMQADYARRIVAEFGFDHLAHHLEGLPE